MLLRGSIAAHELVHDVHQNVEALVRVRLRPGKFIHALDQADFSLGKPPHQVRDGRDRHLDFSEALIMLNSNRLKPRQLLVMLRRRGLKPSLKPSLGVQDELHGLFDVHGNHYSVSAGGKNNR